MLLNMTKRFGIIALLALCTITFAPIASAGLFGDLFDRSKARLETYSKVQDKVLVDAFYSLSEDGKTEGLNKDLATADKTIELSGFSASSITIKKSLFREGNMQSIMGDMNAYTFATDSDDIGKTYIATAKARGNSIKIFKPAIGATINRMFNQNFYLQHDKNTAEWIDRDNVMIEYDSTGKIISFMTRSHQVIVNMGANSSRYVNIYFGANTQVLENKVGNSIFSDNLIREIK
jgi:hypothetical protein